MKLEEWKHNLLDRSAGSQGDLSVSPSFDVKPDSIDELLAHPSCHEQVEKSPMFPPVLPSWGTMFREPPPAGYGDIEFELSEAQHLERIQESSTTEVDSLALTARGRIFPHHKS